MHSSNKLHLLTLIWMFLFHNNCIHASINESELFIKKVAPHGIISIFGGGNHHQFSEKTQAYQLIRHFAKLWTNHPQGLIWPIASGGGSGIMEAAIRGAREARLGKGRAISLSFHFSNSLEKNTPYTIETLHYVYPTLELRENALINHAQGIVIGLGGIGTVWEMMQSLDLIQTKLHKNIPVIILAPKDQGKKFALSFLNLIDMHLINKDHCKLLNITNNPQKTVDLLMMSLEQRIHDRTSSCFI